MVIQVVIKNDSRYRTKSFRRFKNKRLPSPFFITLESLTVIKSSLS